MECPLTPEVLDLALQGRLPPLEAAKLVKHLDTECLACERVLDDAGLEADDLLLQLAAARVGTEPGDSLARVWKRIEPTLERSRREPIAWWRSRLVFAPLAGFAAVAAILLAVFFWPGTAAPPLSGRGGLKGVPVALHASLAVRALTPRPDGKIFDGDTVGFRYGLDRPAFLSLVHLRTGSAPKVLYAGRSDPTADVTGEFRQLDGRLGYRFKNEPGEHVFVLLAAQAAIPEEVALRAALALQPRSAGGAEAKLDGESLAAFVERVHVERAPLSP